MNFHPRAAQFAFLLTLWLWVHPAIAAPDAESPDSESAMAAVDPDLARYWQGVDAPGIKTQRQIVAWAAELGRTVTPEIVNAIMTDLQHEKTPYAYPTRTKTGVADRQRAYDAIIVSLEPKATYKILMKWQRTGKPNDNRNVTWFLNTLKTRRLARQPDGTVWWEPKTSS